MVGDARPYCSVLVLPRAGTDIQQIGAWIDSVNRTLPDYARIQRWALLPQPLTFSDGLLTANGRARRDCIAERYALLIEHLYQNDHFQPNKGGEPNQTSHFVPVSSTGEQTPGVA